MNFKEEKNGEKKYQSQSTFLFRFFAESIKKQSIGYGKSMRLPKKFQSMNFWLTQRLSFLPDGNRTSSQGRKDLQAN